MKFEERGAWAEGPRLIEYERARPDASEGNAEARTGHRIPIGARPRDRQRRRTSASRPEQARLVQSGEPQFARRAPGEHTEPGCESGVGRQLHRRHPLLPKYRADRLRACERGSGAQRHGDRRSRGEAHERARGEEQPHDRGAFAIRCSPGKWHHQNRYVGNTNRTTIIRASRLCSSLWLLSLPYPFCGEGIKIKSMCPYRNGRHPRPLDSGRLVSPEGAYWGDSLPRPCNARGKINAQKQIARSFSSCTYLSSK